MSEVKLFSNESFTSQRAAEQFISDAYIWHSYYAVFINGVWRIARKES